MIEILWNLGSSFIATAAILCYPVISALEEHGRTNSAQNLLGNSYNDLKVQFSLQNCIDENTPPCFLWPRRGKSCSVFALVAVCAGA